MALFDDFFSSSRGPGVIGLLLGAFVLAAFCGLGMAVFDGRLNGDFASSTNKAITDQEGKIKTLQNQVGLLEESLEKARTAKDDQRKISRVVKLAEAKAPELERLQQEVTTAQAEREQVAQRYEDYKQAYRTAERALAKGETIDELKTLDGRVFTKVKIGSVTDLEMRISHSNGLTSIPWKQLPLDLQDRFQFDENIARQARVRADNRQRNVNANVAEARMMKDIDLQERIIDARQFEIKKRETEEQGNITKIAQSKAAALRYREEEKEAINNHHRAQAAGRRSSHMATANKAKTNAERMDRLGRDLQTRNRALQTEVDALKDEIKDAENRIKEITEDIKEHRAKRAKQAREEAQAAKAPE